MASPRSGAGPSATTTTTSTPSIPSHPAHSLLSRAHSPDTAARIFTDKVKNRPLFLASTTTNTFSSSASDKRALRRHIRLRKKEYYLRKRRPRPLSAREKRELGVFELKKEEVKYDVYQGLHALWNGYMLEVLGYRVSSGQNLGQGSRGGNGKKENLNQSTNEVRNKNRNQNHNQNQDQRRKQHQPPAAAAATLSSTKVITAQSHGSLLASADFHGAEVEVVRCADPGRVGTRGIVVRDTKFTFVVVTPGNQVRTLPKKNTVFRYEVRLPLPDEGLGPAGQREEQGLDEESRSQLQPQPQPQPRRLVFEVHGNQFEFRPAERASRKFKWKAMDLL